MSGSNYTYAHTENELHGIYAPDGTLIAETQDGDDPHPFLLAILKHFDVDADLVHANLPSTDGASMPTQL